MSITQERTRYLAKLVIFYMQDYELSIKSEKTIIHVEEWDFIMPFKWIKSEVLHAFSILMGRKGKTRYWVEELNAFKFLRG